MDNIMLQGKFTIETFAREEKLTRASALNKLSKLKKQGLVRVEGGGRQKRIYTITITPQVKSNGFYDLVNRHSPEKLIPRFIHVVHGNYTIEQAIIDGIKLGDVRTLQATKHLFNQVNNWKRLFDLAKKAQVETKVRELYSKARQEMRIRKMPSRYL